MKNWLLMSGACVALAGCASIDAIPLFADGTADTKQVHGIRYYMPSPYLLVTELPVAPQTPTSSSSTTGDTADAGPGGTTTSKGGGGNTTADDSSTPQSSTPTASATDTSFAASMVQYSIKLVYLPDLSRPMALQMHSGLFGTVTAAPTLADGWMLTSLNGSSNSGVADVLTAISGLVGGGGSSASGKASGAAAAAATGAAAAGPAAQAAVVSPGSTMAALTAAGQAVGAGTATMPGPIQLTALSDAQKLTFIEGIANGLKSRPAGSPATLQTIPWGKNVLPAGLYRFSYTAGNVNHATGLLDGITPVVFFCDSGIKVPADPDKNTTPCKHDP